MQSNVVSLSCSRHSAGGPRSDRLHVVRAEQLPQALELDRVVLHDQDAAHPLGEPRLELLRAPRTSSSRLTGLSMYPTAPSDRAVWE